MAKAGETLTTLDGNERELNESMLIIADTKGPIGVAGVMGGLTSEVTDKTTNVLFELLYLMDHLFVVHPKH